LSKDCDLHWRAGVELVAGIGSSLKARSQVSFSNSGKGISRFCFEGFTSIEPERERDLGYGKGGRRRRNLCYGVHHLDVGAQAPYDRV